MVGKMRLLRGLFFSFSLFVLLVEGYRDDGFTAAG